MKNSVLVSLVFSMAASVILFSCSNGRNVALMNEGASHTSVDLMMVGTYDSLVKVKGNPKKETNLKLPRKKWVNNEWVTYQEDTVAFLFYNDGTGYFKHHDSVQLRTVDFYRIQADVYFNNERYNANCSLKEFISRHSVDEEAIQRVSGLLYGDDSREGYVVTLKNNGIPYNEMEVFFNADGYMRYVNFGVYTGGILR